MLNHHPHVEPLSPSLHLLWRGAVRGRGATRGRRAGWASSSNALGSYSLTKLHYGIIAQQNIW